MTLSTQRYSEDPAVAPLPLSANPLSTAREGLPPSRLQSSKKESFFEFCSRNLLELINLKFALVSFVVNTLRRRYHNSVLGFAWSLLNPLLTMGVMALIFSLIFHQDPKRYTVYLFGSMLPWTYIVESLVSGSTALISNESYLKKIYLPKSFFPLVSVSISSCNFVLSLSSLLLLGALFGVPFSSSILFLPLATLVLFCFNFGLSLILSVATLYFRDLTHIVTVFMSVIFYTMPVIYPVEQMPEQYRWIFLYNPFYYFLCLFRTLLYEARIPNLQEWANPVAISITTLVVALFVLQRKEKNIIYRL